MNHIAKVNTMVGRQLLSTRMLCSKIPKNVKEDLITGNKQPENGMVYDKKPFKIELEAGKTYSWCLCGRSKSQPLCDGFHKLTHYKIKQRPVRFTVEETKSYHLCNCKQTLNRPFCDGSHKKLT